MGYSRRRRFHQGFRLGVYPLLELRLLQSMTGPLRRAVRDLRPVPLGSSHGLASPSTLEGRRSHLPGAYLTPYVALSGFLTLSARCSPPSRPVLFHTGGVLGVSPFRAFPSQGAVPPLDGRCPPDVHLSSLHAAGVRHLAPNELSLAARFLLPLDAPDVDPQSSRSPGPSGRSATVDARIADTRSAAPTLRPHAFRHPPAPLLGQRPKPPAPLDPDRRRSASGRWPSAWSVSSTSSGVPPVRPAGVRLVPAPETAP
jgi:hypothetical protein